MCLSPSASTALRLSITSRRLAPPHMSPVSWHLCRPSPLPPGLAAAAPSPQDSLQPGPLGPFSIHPEGSSSSTRPPTLHPANTPLGPGGAQPLPCSGHASPTGLSLAPRTAQGLSRLWNVALAFPLPHTQCWLPSPTGCRESPSFPGTTAPCAGGEGPHGLALRERDLRSHHLTSAWQPTQPVVPSHPSISRNGLLSPDLWLPLPSLLGHRLLLTASQFW